MNSFTVGVLAREAKINIETIRFYEGIKLMPEPKRKESRYRIYNEKDLVRLKFIIRAKELGFTLSEIKELLLLKVDSQSKCRDIKAMADSRISNIEEKIKDLKKIRNHLQVLVSQCVDEELSSDDCPIVMALEP